MDDGNDVARQAESDAGTAFVQLSALTPTMDLTGHDLGSVGVLTPGVYNFSSSAELTGTLTLDFAGAPDSPFVFQIGSTLTTASGSDVAILNGDADSQVYFVVGSSATLGTGTTFAGNILASQSVTMNSGADIMCGRAIALNAAVSMGGNSVSNGCSGPGDLGGGRRDFGSGGYSGGAGGVPEPAPWATMLLGFGGLGLATRRDRDRRIVSGRPVPNGVF